MLDLEPSLIDYDPYSLHMHLGIGGGRQSISAVAVRDRFGVTVRRADVRMSSVPTGIDLGQLPRARFPLFASAIDLQGREIPESKSGPIFASPTDPDFTGGFPLPTEGIDKLNDPVIRRWKADALVAHGRLQALTGEVDRERAYRTKLLGYMVAPLHSSVVLVAAAYLAVLLKVPAWQASVPGAAAAGLMLLAGHLLRRARRCSRHISSAVKAAQEQRLALARLEENLQSAGAASADRGCGCGCQN